MQDVAYINPERLKDSKEYTRTAANDDNSAYPEDSVGNVFSWLKESSHNNHK